MTESSISLVGSRALLDLFGTCDRHVRRLRSELGVQISASDDKIRIEGEDDAVALATRVIEVLQAQLQRHDRLETEDVERALTEVIAGKTAQLVKPIVAFHAQEVRPRTSGQARYIDLVQKHDVVLCAGPAGTGKTFLAVALAVAALREQEVRKIVLVRPAVEAGESLGYLPGDLQAKINPYLRPLMDALNELVGYDLIKRYKEEDVIEVVPLGYMRGRTLNDAFMILDEAQNTTVSQMKMFLTRMGTNSKIVVAGDVTQMDLPAGTKSGLVDGLERLKNVPGIATTRLTAADIVRHALVQRIVAAYDGKRAKH